MSNIDEAAVRATIQKYFDGTRKGDVSLLKQAFHPQARMSGYLQEQLLLGGPEPFYQAVEGSPRPGPEYQTTVVRIETSGPAASAVVEEGPFLGMHFTTYFHLLKIDSNWRIVSKTFCHR